VIFSGEAYNVEQGVTNELFPDERGEAGAPDSRELPQKFALRLRTRSITTSRNRSR
jgi:hypothetical protein